MKKIVLYLFLILGFSCEKAPNIFDDITKKGGFVMFETIPSATYNVQGEDDVVIESRIMDPNKNAVSYSVVILKKDGTLTEPVVTVSPIPGNLVITRQDLVDAYGVEAAVELPSSVNFYGIVTTNEGEVVSGQEAAFDTTTNTPIGGDTYYQGFNNMPNQAMRFKVDLEGTNSLNFIIPIADEADDAEEGITGNTPGDMDVSSSDIEFGEHEGSTRGVQYTAFRFTNIAVPSKTKVKTAKIQFTVDETVDNPAPVTLVVYAEAVDNSTPFEDVLFNISNRMRTSANVEWSIPVWTTVDDAGEDQLTVELKDVVQEVIDRPGWVEGNSLTIIMEPTTATLANGPESGRVAKGGSGTDTQLLISFE